MDTYSTIYLKPELTGLLGSVTCVIGTLSMKQCCFKMAKPTGHLSGILDL